MSQRDATDKPQETVSFRPCGNSPSARHFTLVDLLCMEGIIARIKRNVKRKSGEFLSYFYIRIVIVQDFFVGVPLMGQIVGAVLAHAHAVTVAAHREGKVAVGVGDRKGR